MARDGKARDGKARDSSVSDRADEQHATPPADRNEVLLVGRLSAAAQPRELPSGDVLVQFRLVVSRRVSPADRETRPRRPTVDTIDCVAWQPGLQRSVRAWQAGDVVEVTGGLRRRFWRAGGGPTSRTEVEVERVRRLRKGG